jgi:hypothetical protein
VTPEELDLLHKQADAVAAATAAIEEQRQRIFALEEALRPFALFAVSAKHNRVKCGGKKVPLCGTWVPTPHGDIAYTNHMVPSFLNAVEVFGGERTQKLYEEAQARMQATTAQQEKDVQVAAGIHLAH